MKEIISKERTWLISNPIPHLTRAIALDKSRLRRPREIDYFIKPFSLIFFSFRVDAVTVHHRDRDGNGDSGRFEPPLLVALDGINTQRARFGAAINRLEHTMDNLRQMSSNAAATRGRIQDADYAKESTELARTQIVQQASTAMLTQANASAKTVLELLRG